MAEPLVATQPAPLEPPLLMRLEAGAESSEDAQPDETSPGGGAEPGHQATAAHPTVTSSTPPVLRAINTTVDRVSPSPDSCGSFIQVQTSRSAPVELAHSKSQLKRAQNRAEELRRVFDLPASEAFLDDFMCALKKKVLLQGRLYVFAQHACFHCNLFGYQKHKVIPLSSVVDVRKKKNVGFPNSIELTLEGGKREFFTSFLAREEAYRLLMAQWRQCSEHAPPTPEPDASAELGVGPRSRSVSRLLSGMSLRGMSSLVHRDSWSGGAAGRGTPDAQNGGSGLGVVPEHSDEEGAAAGGGSREGGAHPAPEPSGLVEVPRESMLELLQDNSFIQLGPSARTSVASLDGSLAPAGSGPASPGNGEYGTVVAGDGGSQQQALEFQALTDLQCQKELELEVAQSEPAPPVPPDMKAVLEFDLGCPPLEFFSRFLANHADFFARFHAARGDSNIRTSKWQRHFKVGMVRDLQFVHPVKARIGPPQTACHQTQRLKVFSGRHLVLETSQVMSDIPFGDCFTVETRWDVTPRGDGGSHVSVHLAVPFSKKTMWQRFIEKGSHDDVLEATQRWRQMAADTLSATPSSGLSPVSPEPYSEAEWNALLGRVDPQYRGAVQHLRKHSRHPSGMQGGVHVGRQLPVLARHRRTASRCDATAIAHASRPGSGLGAGSKADSRSSSFRSVVHLAERPAAVPQEQPGVPPGQQQPPAAAAHEQQGQQPPAAAAHEQQVKQQHRGAPLVRPLVALLAWLLRLLRGAAAALSSKQAAAWVACGAVVAVQAVVILHQRQQLAQLQQHVPGGAAPQAGAPAAAVKHVAQAAAALGKDVARMQQALHLLQSQLDAARGTATDLAQRLQHAAAAGS